MLVDEYCQIGTVLRNAQILQTFVVPLYKPKNDRAAGSRMNERYPKFDLQMARKPFEGSRSEYIVEKLREKIINVKSTLLNFNLLFCHKFGTCKHCKYENLANWFDDQVIESFVRCVFL